jgi:hypothetical protein
VHDVDNNNNNSKNFHTHNNPSAFDNHTSRNFLDMSHVMIAEQLTIADAVCLLN